MIIGVCYMLWMFQRVFFEKSNERTATFKDMTSVEVLAFLPIIALILIMGIYPQPFIKKIEPAVKIQISSLLHTMQVADANVLERGRNQEMK